VPQTFARSMQGRAPPLRIGWGMIRPMSAATAPAAAPAPPATAAPSVAPAPAPATPPAEAPEQH
jgi:hypothetical protein